MRDGFDFLDLEDSQVREPPVKAKQWIVVGAYPPRLRLTGNRLVKHTAQGRAVDVFTSDAESDDAAGELIHDH